MPIGTTGVQFLNTNDGGKLYTHYQCGDNGSLLYWVRVKGTYVNISRPLPYAATWGGQSVLSYNGFIYQYGGVNVDNVSIGTNQLWRYNPQNDTWTQLTSSPATGPQTGPAAPAGWAPFVECNGKFYSISGITANNGAGQITTNDVYEYNPKTDTWATMASVPDGLWGACGVINGIIYRVSGETLTGGSQTAVGPAVYAFDPSTNTWLKKADFPDSNGRSTMSVVTYANKLWAFGGQQGGSGTPQQDIYSYDPFRDAWTLMSKFAVASTGTQPLVPFGTAGSVGINGNPSWIINNELYCSSEQDTGSIYIYSFENNAWRNDTVVQASFTDVSQQFGSCIAPIPAGLGQ